MPLYFYQALSRQGKKMTGTVDASSSAAARDQISKMGLFPTAITLMQEAKQEFSLKSLLQRSISAKDKILFTKQFAVLLKSGVPLLQALELLIEQFSGRVRSILVSLKDTVKEGKTLADGLSKYPKDFDTIYIQLVRAGEATGKLEIILERLTLYLERQEATRKEIKAALNGPLIQLGIISIVVLFLMTFVVPRMAETFAQQGATLPINTRILLTLSNFLTGHFILVAIIIGAVVFGFRFWKSTPAGSLLLDKIKLRLPLIKFFAKTSAVVQFSRTLGMLVESGVNLSQALDIVVKIIDNKVLAHSLAQARDKIIKEGKIAPYLKQTGIFPPIAIYLINTGEQTGQLDYMLLTVAKNYEDDLTELTKSLSAKVGPAMMLFMALIVGFIILSIMQPIIQMNQLVSV